MNRRINRQACNGQAEPICLLSSYRCDIRRGRRGERRPLLVYSLGKRYSCRKNSRKFAINSLTKWESVGINYWHDVTSGVTSKTAQERNWFMTEISLNMYHAVALAAGLYWLGNLLCHKLPIFNKYCIPAPLVGGVCFSLLNKMCIRDSI